MPYELSFVRRVPILDREQLVTAELSAWGATDIQVVRLDHRYTTP